MKPLLDTRIEIVESHSLSAADKAKAEELAALCAEADGFPQEFHDDSSLNGDRTLPPWLFARREEELVGMASLFAPSRAEIEVSAWTAPEFRRGGVFGALADAVGRLAEERGIPSLLFCVDSRSVAGAAIAGKLGAVLDFSEYEMVCDVDEWKRRRSSGSGTDWKGESEGPHPARRSGRRGFLPVDLSGFEVRPSLAADVDELARASVDIFGEDHVRETEEKARNFIMVSMTAPLRTQYTALLDGRIVGMCAVSAWTSPAQSKTVMLNGLGISSALRGQGLGRELLYRVMEIAAEGGAKRIALEVDSVNEAAYPLYLSAGFVQTLRTDYYRLKSASPP